MTGRMKQAAEVAARKVLSAQRHRHVAMLLADEVDKAGCWDLKLVCGDGEVCVSRQRLSYQQFSEPFKRLVDPGFKESVDGRVVLPSSLTVAVVRKLCRFLYSGIAELDRECVLALYQLAELYLIPDLADDCRTWMIEHMQAEFAEEAFAIRKEVFERGPNAGPFEREVLWDALDFQVESERISRKWVKSRLDSALGEFTSNLFHARFYAAFDTPGKLKCMTSQDLAAIGVSPEETRLAVINQFSCIEQPANHLNQTDMSPPIFSDSDESETSDIENESTESTNEGGTKAAVDTAAAGSTEDLLGEPKRCGPRQKDSERFEGAGRVYCWEQPVSVWDLLDMRASEGERVCGSLLLYALAVVNAPPDIIASFSDEATVSGLELLEAALKCDDQSESHCLLHEVEDVNTSRHMLHLGTRILRLTIRFIEESPWLTTKERRKDLSTIPFDKVPPQDLQYLVLRHQLLRESKVVRRAIWALSSKPEWREQLTNLVFFDSQAVKHASSSLLGQVHAAERAQTLAERERDAALERVKALEDALGALRATVDGAVASALSRE